MKSTAAKLIETYKSSKSPIDIDHRDILLAILGYSEKRLNGKRAPKHLTFDVWRLASSSEVGILTDIMLKANYPATDEDSVVMISQSSSKDVLKNYNKETLENMIADALSTDDPLPVDRIWEIYVIAAYLRKKKVRKIVVVISVTLITAAVATGLFVFFNGDRSDDNDCDIDIDPDIDVDDETGEVVTIDDLDIMVPVESDDGIPGDTEA